LSHTVYLITNAVTGRVYVGQTENPARRFSHHLNGNSGQLTDLTEYGREVFAFELLSTHDSREAAIAEEARMIERLGSDNPARGYNRRPSGGPGEGNTNARANRVSRYTLGGKLVATYRSEKQASEMSGIARTHIGRVCRAAGTDPKWATAGGYVWRYS
jgi:predicted GIY-YIG superfamily endonuclease